MSKLVLAIVGLPGAGKTEATNFVVNKYGWPKVYLGQAVIDEVKNRGQEINEANERAVREELRAKGGIGVLADLNLPKINELLKTANVVVIESHYSWEEYLIFKKEYGEQFKVLAIFSSPLQRVARLSSRPERPLTASEVESRDYSQIENLHQAGPIARADYTIVNEGSLEELYKNLEIAIEKIAPEK